LEQLNYNEQDHALARSEVERWRWAEIRQGKSKMPRGDKRFKGATRNESANCCFESQNGAATN